MVRVGKQARKLLISIPNLITGLRTVASSHCFYTLHLCSIIADLKERTGFIVAMGFEMLK